MILSPIVSGQRRHANRHPAGRLTLDTHDPSATLQPRLMTLAVGRVSGHRIVGGEIGPPCGVPSVVGDTRPASMPPASRYRLTSLSTRLSFTPGLKRDPATFDRCDAKIKRVRLMPDDEGLFLDETGEVPSRGETMIRATRTKPREMVRAMPA